MNTPTPDDLTRQAAEFAKNQCMEMTTTPKTDVDEARERNLRLVNENIVLTKDRDAWKAKAERTCKWTLTKKMQFTGYVAECTRADGILTWYSGSIYTYCPFCSGLIVKEEK